MDPQARDQFGIGGGGDRAGPEARAGGAAPLPQSLPCCKGAAGWVEDFTKQGSAEMPPQAETGPCTAVAVQAQCSWAPRWLLQLHYSQDKHPMHSQYLGGALAPAAVQTAFPQAPA